MFGVIVVILVWALLMAWIARTAIAHGRFGVLWGIGGGAVGAGAFAAGLAIVSQSVDADMSAGVLVGALLIPIALMVGSMVALALVLRRGGIQVAAKKVTPIHFLDRGAGQLRIEGENVSFTWRDGSRAATRGALETVVADGEVVRVSVGGDELCFMPMGKPETPEGRRQQSITIAGRLRVR